MPEEKIAYDFSIADTLCLKIGGDWRISAGLPSVEAASEQLKTHPGVRRATFNVSEGFQWDSAFIAYLVSLSKECAQRKIELASSGLPEGIRKLLILAMSAHHAPAPPKKPQATFLEKAADFALRIETSVASLLEFLGEAVLALKKFITGKAYFRKEDFAIIIQRCGVHALGLVSLISVLVGMILAFIGAIQLQMFGAQVYIADIVGIGMVRVMGAVMTGVLMSGRTGASFAAELGIMQANEEIDALRTLGVNPVEFLVLPRLLALVIMMPLLVVYADLMGIVGGFIVSVGMIGINPIEYYNHTQAAVRMSHLWVGLVHSFVFGIIIAVCGCMYGINCEKSAEGVGVATTSAVVSSITYIVIATAAITYVCQILGV